MNKKLRHFFLPLALLFGTIGLIIYQGTITFALKPKDEEKVKLLIASNGCKKKELSEALIGKGLEGVKEITIIDLSLSAIDFYASYNVFAPAMDLIILPETKAKQGIGKDSLELNYEVLRNYGVDETLNYFKEEGNKPKGLEIYEKDSRKGYAKQYIDYGEGENYYIFIPHSSKQAGDLNGSERKGALSVLGRLVSLP